jgi:hypothetical protein
VGDPAQHPIVGGAPATLVAVGFFLAAQAGDALLIRVMYSPPSRQKRAGSSKWIENTCKTKDQHVSASGRKVL